VVGNEWRLIQPLRDAAMTKNSTTILTAAVVAQCRHHLIPSTRNLGMALADLAVTGRVAFQDFVNISPQENGPIQAAALAALAGTSGVTAQLVQTAMSEVLDRAYQVAWYLRAQTSRGNLGWIAVSGEDDLPHRPVNVPRTTFPQCDLYFTVPGDLGAVVVQTRYAIATATDPTPTQVSLPQRSLPPVFQPALPPDDRIILFIHGSDSRLEEANDIIPKLVRLPDGRPSGFCVISLDLPGSGYVNQIDHTEVGPWTAASVAVWPLPPVGIGSVTISLLPFLEKFIVNFVTALSSRLGQPGLVESSIAAVMGGSLGGNLALRLARRPEKWIANAVAFSPGSVWRASPTAGADPIEMRDAGLLQAGVLLAIPSVGLMEDPASRDQFFAGAFDQKIPVKTQPEQWYRDDFPSKTQNITNARLDRRETYTSQYRRWHWRVSLEELLWSWRDPAVQNFRSRVLLGAGAADDIEPAHIFTNTRKLAAELGGTNGDTFFFEHTGHSIHSERPDALARKIMAFLTFQPDWQWSNMGKPPTANIRLWLGTVTVMDSPTAPQRAHLFFEANDFNVWCLWSDGMNWHWLNMGKPPTANINGAVGAVTVMDTPTGPQRTHLFVTGNDGNMWCLWSDAAAWHWLNMGKPPTANIRGLLGAVTVMDTTTSPQRAHVFVEGNDFNLWCLWSDAAAWHWLNMSKPQTANINGSVGAVTVMDTPTAAQRTHLFVTGNDGNLWCRWSDGMDWHWMNMGKPLTANIAVSAGAVTVMDAPAGPQRTHVFVLGNDGNIWVDWWG
jgi:pimeloyl-ACP methyl ester carboxylesterase